MMHHSQTFLGHILIDALNDSLTQIMLNKVLRLFFLVCQTL